MADFNIAKQIVELYSQIKPYTVVNEYENALYMTIGKTLAIKKSKKRLSKHLLKNWHEHRKELEKENLPLENMPPKNILELSLLEEKVGEEFRKIYDSPFDPDIDEEYSDWKVSRVGKPLHPIRYGRNLPHGFYPHLPLFFGIQKVPKMSVVPQVKDLKLISILAYGKIAGHILQTKDLKKENPRTILQDSVSNELNSELNPLDLHSVMVGGMLRYRIEDMFKAYTKIGDWETSYQSQALIIISRHCRGKTLNDFYSGDFMNGLEKTLKEELNKMPREKWGIETLEVGFPTVSTHVLSRNIQELSSDAFYVNVSTTQPSKNDDEE